VKQAELLIEEYKYPLNFDIPFKELMFTGCHSKSSVNICPSSQCLVSLQEFPFFVIDIEDIELGHFERIGYMTKNFDLALVYKDYTNYHRISAIPMEFLETIKSWLDATGIIFTEGPMCLKWPQILQTIRDDFEGFLETGGWSFLADNATEEDNSHRGGADSQPESDSDFDPSGDEEEGSSSDDYSGEDGDSESEAESSDVKPEEDSEEEGLDWDEMDRRAIEQEKKAAELARIKARGGMPPAKPPQTKKSAPPSSTNF